MITEQDIVDAVNKTLKENSVKKSKAEVSEFAKMCAEILPKLKNVKATKVVARYNPKEGKNFPIDLDFS